MNALAAIGLFYVVIGVVTLCAFGLDKGAAILGKRRISEVTLHRLESLGGWPAALIAMRLFNHKHNKAPYRRGQLRAIALHCTGIALVGLLYYFFEERHG